MAGDARALLGDGLLGDLDQNLLAGLQKVGDDGQIGGLYGAARGDTAAIALGAGGSAGATDAGAAIAALRRGCLARGLRLGDGLFLLVAFVEGLVLAVLLVEAQLDAVVEMRFLKQLAKVA